MLRNLFTVWLTLALTLFSIGPTVYGQYAAPSDPGQGYPGQQYPQPYPQQDPSAAQDIAGDEQHGVARLSVVQGDVNVRRGDNGELVAAVINAPLVVQDHLQTSPGSRAEVELDYGNLIRLAPNTDVSFSDLQYHRYQLQLGAGTIIYRVLRDSNARAEIDTPSVGFRPEGQGEYRISVLEDGTTQITVRAGQGEIFSQRNSERLDAGRTVLVRGNPADPELQPTYEPPRDQFDDWSATRDRELLSSQSYGHVSRDIYGADDLDAYGNWVPSQYGQVWEPNVPAADWSPYSDGQWSWQPYYGWTWVDAAPWGWAPYHYGRWFWNGGHRWCWWPGPVGPRYLWSPAQVGFFGWGAGAGVGFAGLGWVALAPFEVFHPWWGHGWGRGGYGYGDYYGRRDFGLVRGANVAAMYRNAAIRGGAMTAPYNGFGGPHQRFSPALRGQLSAASVFRGQMPIAPTPGSYRFSDRRANVNPQLASAANRQFFYHAGTGFRNAPAGAWQGTRAQPPNAQGSYADRRGYSAPARTPSAGGWQRFGEPGAANGTKQGFVGGQEPSGWHHFGEARQSPTPSYNGGAGTYGGNYGSRSFRSAPPAASPPQRQNFSGYAGPSNGGFGGGRPSYSAPHFSAPAAPRYNAPSPSSHGGGREGGGSRGGDHSSSGGHRGR